MEWKKPHFFLKGFQVICAMQNLKLQKLQIENGVFCWRNTVYYVSKDF